MLGPGHAALKGQRDRECKHEHGDNERHEERQGHSQRHSRQPVRLWNLSYPALARARTDAMVVFIHHQTFLLRLSWNLRSCSNIDKVEQEMEDIREQMELGAEISAAISNPVAMGQEVGLTRSIHEQLSGVVAACSECFRISHRVMYTDNVLVTITDGRGRAASRAGRAGARNARCTVGRRTSGTNAFTRLEDTCYTLAVSPHDENDRRRGRRCRVERTSSSSGGMILMQIVHFLFQAAIVSLFSEGIVVSTLTSPSYTSPRSHEIQNSVVLSFFRSRPPAYLALRTLNRMLQSAW